MTRQPTDRPRASMAPAIDPAAIDALRALQEDGEPDLLAELTELFLDDAGPRRDRLREAVHRNDAPAVEREAHALKGAAGNFGARPLADICERLQRAAGSGDLTDTPALLARLEEEVARVRVALHAEVAGDTHEHPDRRG